MRNNRKKISNEVRDRYYFIDYLRLHKYGKEKGFWKKNRNMLVKEDQNDPSSRARKGYQSYVQRCLKSILDNMYSDFTVVKPRGIFGYEIGKKNDNNNEMLKPFGEGADTNEDKIKLVIQRNLVSNSYLNLITEYRASILEGKCIAFKNREAGLTIRLDQERSFGYPAIKSLEVIREVQDQMIKEFDDPAKVVGELLSASLDRIVKYQKGTRVSYTDRSGIVQGQGVITGSAVNVDRHYGTDIQYVIEKENGRETMGIAFLRIIRSEDDIIEVGESPGAVLLDRIIDYANENFGDTSGIDSSAIFSLARAAVAREIINGNEIDLAAEIRRIEPSATVLSRIITNHQVDEDDEDYDEEEEYYDEDEL